MAPGTQGADILPLLTHSLVEEALYKGVLNLTNGHKGKLCIEYATEQDTLVVRVTDNGISRQDAARLDKKKGMMNGDDTMLLRRIDLFNAQGKRKITSSRSVLQEDGAALNSATLEIPQPLFDKI